MLITCVPSFSISRCSHRGQVSLLDFSYPCTCPDRLNTTNSLKRWCNVSPENIKDEIARFENMILEEGARLKEKGEKGLEILPGAQRLLDSVRTSLPGGEAGN